MSLLKENPNHYKQFPKQEIDALRETSQQFYETLDAHFRQLSTVKTVTEGIVKAVADEVAKKKGPPNTYNASAALQSTQQTRSTRVHNGSISFNEVV
ncbi:hypothetical protein [Sneathiella glossodoripedis]|uniref:hypothetical protein n=1 Tax=Sneathiella glossodoripedis TaxID=418853 RepID=UPI000470822B|nr:hypothetical protein [Sneathiella glossodoripedis]